MNGLRFGYWWWMQIPVGGDLRSQLDQILDVEIAGIDRSPRAALNQV
jgi:hypothetical protein